MGIVYLGNYYGFTIGNFIFNKTKDLRNKIYLLQLLPVMASPIT